MKRHLTLENIVEPTINGVGLDFVGLEYINQGRQSVLRIYIDKPDGVDTSDCQKVSQQLSAILDVEGNFNGPYHLEVSSPGADRIFFTEEQMADYVGKLVSVRLSCSIDGRKNFKGHLKSVNNGQVHVTLPEGDVVFSFNDIDKARLVPEWVN